MQQNLSLRELLLARALPPTPARGSWQVGELIQAFKEAEASSTQSLATRVQHLHRKRGVAKLSKCQKQRQKDTARFDALILALQNLLKDNKKNSEKVVAGLEKLLLEQKNSAATSRVATGKPAAATETAARVVSETQGSWAERAAAVANKPAPPPRPPKSPGGQSKVGRCQGGSGPCCTGPQTQMCGKSTCNNCKSCYCMC